MRRTIESGRSQSYDGAGTTGRATDIDDRRKRIHAVRPKGIAIEVKKSAGSNENLSAVDASAKTIGPAFIGSAFDAVNRTGRAEQIAAKERIPSPSPGFKPDSFQAPEARKAREQVWLRRQMFRDRHLVSRST